MKLQKNFIEMTLWHGCSPANLMHIFRTSCPKNTSGGLLLTLRKIFCGSSTGTGLTAVIIAIIRGMAMYNTSGKVNVQKIVSDIRRDLAGAIETPEQLRLVYLVIRFFELVFRTLLNIYDGAF